MPRKITIQPLVKQEQAVEIVERKGIGHPDTICDSLMESISVELCKEYMARLGFIAHHNIDKGLLVAGRTGIKFGGGVVQEPMRIIIGDRATFEADKKEIPVNDIAVRAAKSWFKENLRFVNRDEVIYQSELKPGSPELAAIFKRTGILGSNDTSAAIGYAPLSPTEKLVLNTEKHLNSRGFKRRFPETGEDVKIMALRQGADTSLTVAMSFVDRFVPTEPEYFRSKAEVLDAIMEFTGLKDVTLNNLDERGKGIEGVYLTVTGTSAESGDCGEVGRGNRVNGIIPLLRPLGSEAAAGKNPVSHVGKIYNILSHKIAADIVEHAPGVSEAYVWMVTRIGTPIDKPMVYVQLAPEKGATLAEISKPAEEQVVKNLDEIPLFCIDLSKGKYPVC